MDYSPLDYDPINAVFRMRVRLHIRRLAWGKPPIWRSETEITILADIFPFATEEN
jgi:hypothetical protein